MEVTSHTPPSRHQQHALLHLSLSGPVLGTDELGIATPHLTPSVGAADQLALVVCLVVDPNRKQPDGEDRGRKGRTQVIGMVNEVEGMGSVDGRHPH